MTDRWTAGLFESSCPQREPKKSWFHAACAKGTTANGMLVELAQLCEFILTDIILLAHLLYLVTTHMALGAGQTGA